MIAFVLLLSMLWQSIGLAFAGSTVDADADREHAVLHWQGGAHHHHDDGAYHVQDSAESMQHLLADHGATPLGLPLGTAMSFSPTGSARPGSVQASMSPHPDPDGLFRPPRLPT